MSAVLDTPNLRQRRGLAAYNAARAQAILTSERLTARVADRALRAQARPLPIHRTCSRPTRWQRLRASLAAEYGRAWPMALLGALLYFLGGALASGIVVAVCAGGWQP